TLRVVLSSFLSFTRPPPRSPLFPYTTLFRSRFRPHLVRDQRLSAPARERSRQHTRRLAVHRRRVEQVRAGPERGVDDLAPRALGAGAAHVERLPGSHADRRDGEAAAAEGSLVHRSSSPWRVLPARSGSARDVPTTCAARTPGSGRTDRERR